MTDEQPQQATIESSAGAMIRAARQAQGVHIAQLAASIKVSVRKLEALEADRLDELPDATFARALAQTVCRSLKIDPAPVLALLPSPGTLSQLEEVAQGLNQPFREPGGPGAGSPVLGVLKRPVVWVVVLLVAGAAVLWSIPSSTWQEWLGRHDPTAASGLRVEVVPVEPSASLEVPASAAPVVSAAASTPAPAVQQAAPASPVAPTAAVLVRTRAESWIEIQDANGRILLSRLLAPGEEVSLDGAFPMRVRVGNAEATELRVRGQVFDMTPFRRENVARFEIR
ncbi:helix-turn-helix domain-containing protein [Caldimonas manganoxidans]|uniref:helix-turn-helix domain-containing protein n=1 Tax=Caldimonas manganoxidans TaxID=196015 RepID=UPI0003746B14|nr:helix-turn-helix domain-containing protein [Caldimonas manganoxidans]